jgi:hypothetical protein
MSTNQMGFPTAARTRHSIVVALALLVSVAATLIHIGTAQAAITTFPLNIDFAPAATTPPAGYTVDSGASYSAARGYGWVREDSLTTAVHAPVDLSPNTRTRTSQGSALQKTFIHMQLTPTSRVTPAVNISGAWDVDLPIGQYTVTVGVGDADNYDSTHVIRAEGQTVVPAFTPTKISAFATLTANVAVTDGQLTVDAIGGTNTKLDFLTIAPTPDTTPPAAVTGLTAAASDGQIKLDWNAGSEPDLAGYDVFRSTTTPVLTSGSPLNGATRLTAPTYTDTTAFNGTAYNYVVRAADTAGNRSVSAPVNATPTGPPHAFNRSFDFEPATSPVVDGYTPDTGAAYDAGRGFGWVRESSLGAASHDPVDISPNARARTTTGTALQKTFLHMQFPSNSATPGAVHVNAAWDVDLPNDTYTVMVGVGDADTYDSTHVIRVEGQTVVPSFVPTKTNPFYTGVANVVITDGKLTVDAVGGTNTKIGSIAIAAASDVTPPPAVTGLTTDAGDGQIALAWNPSAASDVVGYDVYRSTSTPVPTTAPLNGLTKLTSATFTDTTPFNGTTYYYVVKTTDTSGNSSVSSPVSDTPVGAPPRLDLNINFQPSGITPPTGFTPDTGLAFSTARGYGWVRQDSLAGGHVSLDLSANTRKRSAVADPRLDTIIHMQFPAGKPGGNTTPGAWEAVVPNGSYDVQVGVGDPGYFDSKNAINIEGQVAIQNFVPSTAVPFKTVTRTVNVADGRLTIDAVGGTNTKLDYVTISTAPLGNRPSVRVVNPADGATGVNRATSVNADLNLPNVGAGVDTNTLSSSTVRLVRAADDVAVPAHVNTSGGGDTIILQPTATLAANTQYRFEVTKGVKDLTGAPFLPTSSTLTTGTVTGSGNTSPAKFEQVTLPTATGKSFGSLTMGPDGKLYASTLDGDIVRFPVNADGTLGAMETLSGATTANGGTPRMLTGLAFDPASTAGNLVLWVTSNYLAYSEGPEWSGQIIRMSGPDLATVQTEITGLPRSARDHATNSLAFGPEGALYVTQGSNSSSGAPDPIWDNRPERLLSAATLRIDTNKLTAANVPLNVQTEGLPTNYNPYAAGAPLTIYADGIRNAFDLVFHSNGSLYEPTNGAAAGGNTPATPNPLPAQCANRIDAGTNGPYTGPSVPALTNLGVAANDFLFRVVKGGYYGHPNTARCEFVANGGNPTSGPDPGEIAPSATSVGYPVGTQHDRNWRGAAFDFGPHFSPDGAIEYTGTAFGGALDNALLVTRYSAGDDIIALTPGASGDIINAETGITGFTGLDDPLDLAEDAGTGNIYVSQLGNQSILLLRPSTSTGTPAISTAASKTYLNAVVGTTSAPKDITIKNTGGAPLSIASATIDGDNPTEFARAGSGPSFPIAIPAGQTQTLSITFSPTAAGARAATLHLASNDPANPVLDVRLRGLGATGSPGIGEPSLQQILDTYQAPIAVGDPDPTTAALPATNPLGDEVYLQRMRKAGDANPTIQPIAVFAADGASGTAATVGWNRAGSTAQNASLLSVSNPSDQAVDPTWTGTTTFDPGNASFGFYATFPAIAPRAVYGEDALNTFAGALPHQARFYQYKDTAGNVVPNAYVTAFEDQTSGLDYNDVVAIIRNVEPAPTNARIAFTNPDGQPYDNRLVFSRIGSLAAPPANGVHDRGTARINNTGTDPLLVSNLTITGPFQLDNPPSLPVTVAPGASLNVGVKFVATSGKVSTGNLTVTSNDPNRSTAQVQLAGYWQSVSEGNQEPTLSQIVNGVMGYTTAITRTGQTVDQAGLGGSPIGDEILSPYWQRLDTNKGVTVSQLAAFHTQGNGASLAYYQRGGSTFKSVVSMNGVDGQSILPHAAGSTTNLAGGTFFPPAEFGFRVDSNEYSDDTKNSVVADQNAGCPGPCGHHMRFYPLLDRDGNAVAGSYLAVMDYSGINYDYQDNVYLLTNLRPDNDGATLARIDVGGSSPFTDARGRVWQPDTGLFSPASAPVEGAATTPLAIDNTTDDVIYDTYRGNVGSVPQAQRILDYAITVPGVTAVDVRLHVAERTAANNASGRRVFDVFAEGSKVVSAMDIFASAGAMNTAYVRAINNIAVTDGVLNLSFRATTDYPSIAGIEVLCAAGCPAQ